MGIELAIFFAIYSLIYTILRKIIAGNEEKQLSKQGKLVNWFGKGMLLLIGVATVVYVSLVEVEVDFIYWFILFYMIAATGLELFIDWVYRKETKEYIVSILTIIVGTISYCALFLI